MMGKVVLSSPVTHSDWMWRYEKRIGYGKKSVKYILDRCKEVGWQKIYWRCFDGGRALYSSKLMDEEWVGFDEDNYHAWVNPGKEDFSFFKRYKGFDSLKEAVSYGHKIDLEVHAWLTVNEDDHAWGLISRFSRKHPQFRWVKKCGLPYNSQLSFAFKQVRKYKLDLLKEILEYDIDGIFFDWIRTGDVRNEPQTIPDGTADFGYEKPLVEGFKKKYGIDPRSIPNNDKRWVQFRAEPQTVFMREAHKLIKGKNKSLAISAMVHHPWSYRGGTPLINGSFYGLLLDIGGWVKEGLIDEIVAAGYYTKGGTPEKAYHYLKGEVKNHCDIWLWWWVPPDAGDFEKSVKTAEKFGAKQILYWESDYIDLPERAANAKKLTEEMAKYVQGK